MSEDEMRARLEEELKRLSVDDVVIQTAVTLVNLGGMRLGLVPGSEGERDLDQAKTAIEAVSALMPLLPEDVQTPLRDALSQLQMGFAQVARGGGQPEAASQPAPDAGAPPEAGEPPRAPSPDDEAERAKARSKIWTPPGT